MKLILLVAGLLATPAFGQALLSTNHSAIAKNVLAFYLVSGDVPRESLMDGTAAVAGLKLAPQPVLSDADFVDWNLTNHTLVITPGAAIRVGIKCGEHETPFVLVANGVPIYLGAFWTLASSRSCGVPVIIADLAVADCFMGVHQAPDDVWRIVRARGADTIERLLALAKTSPTTNVTLQIDPGYASFSAVAKKQAEKRRSDPRVAAAVQKLFAGRGK